MAEESIFDKERKKLKKAEKRDATTRDYSAKPTSKQQRRQPFAGERNKNNKGAFEAAGMK